MAKRFTDTDIFKKQFVRGLKSSYKLLWFYILADCNHAGIWECDFEVAALRIGETIDRAEAEQLFAGKFIALDENSKWFLPSFIEFQYGELRQNNRAHTAVISALSKYGLIDENNNLLKNQQAPCKPLTSPLQGAKDKEQEKEKEKDKEKDKDKEQETREQKLKKRETDFIETLKPFLGQYPRDMMMAFFSYWTEPNPAKTKMRFEQQPTWEVSRRLKTWAENQKNFKKPQNERISKNNELDQLLSQSINDLRAA